MQTMKNTPTRKQQTWNGKQMINQMAVVEKKERGNICSAILPRISVAAVLIWDYKGTFEKESKGFVNDRHKS